MCPLTQNSMKNGNYHVGLLLLEEAFQKFLDQQQNLYQSDIC